MYHAFLPVLRTPFSSSCNFLFVLPFVAQKLLHCLDGAEGEGVGVEAAAFANFAMEPCWPMVGDKC